jgi:DNA-binding response OmpR family regulator
MMVSAYGDGERRQRAAEYGAADFLAKPIDFGAPEGAAAAIARRPD